MYACFLLNGVIHWYSHFHLIITAILWRNFIIFLIQHELGKSTMSARLNYTAKWKPTQTAPNSYLQNVKQSHTQFLVHQLDPNFFSEFVRQWHEVKIYIIVFPLCALPNFCALPNYSDRNGKFPQRMGYICLRFYF